MKYADGVYRSPVPCLALGATCCDSQLQETPYEQSFVSAMVPKLEYDALLKAGHGMASGHIRASGLISDVTSPDKP